MEINMTFNPINKNRNKSRRKIEYLLSPTFKSAYISSLEHQANVLITLIPQSINRIKMKTSRHILIDIVRLGHSLCLLVI